MGEWVEGSGKSGGVVEVMRVRRVWCFADSENTVLSACEVMFVSIACECMVSVCIRVELLAGQVV